MYIQRSAISFRYIREKTNIQRSYSSATQQISWTKHWQIWSKLSYEWI